MRAALVIPTARNKGLMVFFYFVLSFLIVVLAQPDWSTFACILASGLGYALFWRGMQLIKSWKIRFLQAVVWFALIQAVQVSWFAADRYVGAYIYLFLIPLFLALGIQFGLISLLVRDLTILRMLGISGGWAIMEWIRLYCLSGYSWNPVAMALGGNGYAMQMASVTGIFGLSFWIFFTNLCALRIMDHFASARAASAAIFWLIVASIPYSFGWAHLKFHDKQMQKSSRFLSALLVQSSLYPEEKFTLNGSEPLSPDIQWERMLALLVPYESTASDLIVFSEAAVPYGTHLPIYPIQNIKSAFQHFFGEINALPFSEEKYEDNAYWARSVANQFSADVVIGLEEYDRGEDGRVITAYNAAFLISPHLIPMQRYEKRVLVPMGEYIPFSWCRKFLAKYGIHDSFSAGTEAKVLQTKQLSIGLSICYEETYGNLVRQSRQRGGELLINLSNDVWYPKSRLPIVHFFHGRLRAVESGVPLLRCCNTGVTCGVDSLGRIISQLPHESATHLASAQVLNVQLPLYSYPTFYTRCGDFPVIIVSSLSFCFLFIKRRLFRINILDIYPLRKN